MAKCFMADAFGDMRQWSHRNKTFFYVCGVLQVKSISLVENLGCIYLVHVSQF